MRVVVVTESFLPTINGVTNSVCRMLHYLRTNGHQAIVVAPAAGAPAQYAGFPVFEMPAVTYRQFPLGLPSTHLQKLIAAFSPDIVHAAAPFLLGAQAISAGRRLGIASVAVFQTDVAAYARTNHLVAATGLAWRIIRRAHDGADLTLAPSSASMARLMNAGIGPLQRWGRGVDLDVFHPRNRLAPAVLRARGRLAPSGEVIVGYVGRVAPEKQLGRLAALRGLSGIHLVIVGNGPSLTELKRELAGMPVTFLGELRGAELAAAYSTFDVFLHTGTGETFGQTVQEAQASGIPVIAPRAGGPIDLIDHGHSGLLFEAHDDADMRRCVERMLNDHPMRLRVGEAGRRSVRGRSWETVCDELVVHYGTAIRARAASVTAKVS